MWPTTSRRDPNGRATASSPTSGQGQRRGKPPTGEAKRARGTTRTNKKTTSNTNMQEHTNMFKTASNTNMRAPKSTSAPKKTAFRKNCHLWRARVKAEKWNARSQSRPLIQRRTPGRAGVLTFLRAPAQPSSKKHSLLYVPEGPTLRRVGTAVAAILRQDVH